MLTALDSNRLSQSQAACDGTDHIPVFRKRSVLITTRPSSVIVTYKRQDEDESPRVPPLSAPPTDGTYQFVWDMDTLLCASALPRDNNLTATVLETSGTKCQLLPAARLTTLQLPLSSLTIPPPPRIPLPSPPLPRERVDINIPLEQQR